MKTKSIFGIMGVLVTSTALYTAAAIAEESKQAVTAGPTDPQIAAIVVVANQVDVDAGRVGKKSKSKEVRAFANQMITDHTAVNKQAVALVTKLHVKPEESDTSKALKDGGKENIANLKKLKGDEFDKAYVDHEVAYHQHVLDTIDKTLIPNAKNPELKALLEKVRPAIDAHLKHAQRMQASMSKSG